MLIARIEISEPIPIQGGPGKTTFVVLGLKLCKPLKRLVSRSASINSASHSTE